MGEQKWRIFHSLHILRREMKGKSLSVPVYRLSKRSVRPEREQLSSWAMEMRVQLV